MPLSVPPVVDERGFQIKYEVADRDSCVDFAFWGGLTPGCVGNLKELDRLGCVAYKGFMSFANPDYPQITDGYLVQGMRNAAEFDGLIGVHAENAEAAEFGTQEMAGRQGATCSMHDEARPWWVELEAIMCIRDSQEIVQELSETYGLKINPRARVSDLTVGLQQRVEILKALYLGAEILIMDEPTAVLTPQEILQLMDTLMNLKKKGKCIICLLYTSRCV